MKLTSKGEYALKGILDVINNGDGNPVRLQEISERQGISRSFLEQLFHRMKKSGLVTSIRGPGGGYLVSRPLSDISVKEVLASVGERLQFSYAETDTPEGQAFDRFFGKMGLSITQHLNLTLEDVTKVTEG